LGEPQVVSAETASVQPIPEAEVPQEDMVGQEVVPTARRAPEQSLFGAKSFDLSLDSFLDLDDVDGEAATAAVANSTIAPVTPSPTPPPTNEANCLDDPGWETHCGVLLTDDNSRCTGSQAMANHCKKTCDLCGKVHPKIGLDGQSIPPPPSPTKSPTVAVTKSPTKATTKAPTVAATKAPTVAVTKAPTVAVTKAPTVAVTKAPTMAPTAAVTKAPTVAVTKAPTVAVTKAPTVASGGKQFIRLDDAQDYV